MRCRIPWILNTAIYYVRGGDVTGGRGRRMSRRSSVALLGNLLCLVGKISKCYAGSDWERFLTCVCECVVFDFKTPCALHSIAARLGYDVGSDKVMFSEE